MNCDEENTSKRFRDCVFVVNQELKLDWKAAPKGPNLGEKIFFSGASSGTSRTEGKNLLRGGGKFVPCVESAERQSKQKSWVAYQWGSTYLPFSGGQGKVRPAVRGYLYDRRPRNDRE